MAEESLDAIVAARNKKRADLISAGVNPYPSKSERTHTIAEARKAEGKKVTVVGRLRSLRPHGAILFADLEDASGRIQLLIKDTADREHPGGVDPGLHPRGGGGRLINFLDIGDIVEGHGKVIITKAGELTVDVAKLTLLAKSLRPLPSEHFGLKEVEERYRRRYVDLLVNPEVRQLFEVRSRIVSSIRTFLEQKGFLEVETPVLQNIAGGTLARPFSTHYHAYDSDVFLRVAPELYLKRLIVGGFEKVYEFARCFRNEGVDATHNPEFTNLEFYWAFADFEQMMALTEELLKTVVKDLGKQIKPTFEDKPITFPKEFPTKTFSEMTGGKMNDESFKAHIKSIGGPLFVTHHPVAMSPLAKKSSNPELVERFQLILGGLEVANAWSEINDPVDQKERFEIQQQERESGSQETHPYDHDFVEALEYGMPPTAGCGIGIDRLAMLLTGSHTLREVLLFPYMKAKKS